MLATFIPIMNRVTDDEFVLKSISSRLNTVFEVNFSSSPLCLEFIRKPNIITMMAMKMMVMQPPVFVL